MDKHYSKKFSELSLPWLELILVVPAHYFYRTWGVVQCILFSSVIGAYHYNEMLENLNFLTIQTPITFTQKFRLGLVFMFLIAFALLGTVITTQSLKYTLRRKRPEHNKNVARFKNCLRETEEGTYSMPSGDSTAAGLYCFILCYVAGMQWIYLLLPLVMMGRVYYHCHWFGDTIIGAVMGTAWGFVAKNYFFLLLPFAKFVAGPGTFVPA